MKMTPKALPLGPTLASKLVKVLTQRESKKTSKNTPPKNLQHARKGPQNGGDLFYLLARFWGPGTTCGPWGAQGLKKHKKRQTTQKSEQKKKKNWTTHRQPLRPLHTHPTRDTKQYVQIVRGATVPRRMASSINVQPLNLLKFVTALPSP